MKALSIRQPWAWLIVTGHKIIENRERNIGTHFGPLLIHASKSMTGADYMACTLFLRSNPRLAHLLDILPQPSEFAYGGIVGSVNLFAKLAPAADCIQPGERAADWYTGDVGYWFKDAKSLPFHPCKGRLGFFKVYYPFDGGEA